MKRISTITICSSVSFYEEVLKIKQQLKRKGFKVLIPNIANVMKKTGDFNPETYKTWYKNPSDYKEKTKLMNKHFDKVIKGDAILVINNTKHNLSGYIGGNVLMEMTIAHHYKKPIFILNPISEDISIKEEIYALNPVFLMGNINNLPLPQQK